MSEALHRVEFPDRPEVEHVVHEGLRAALVAAGLEAWDTSWHNDTDMSMGVGLSGGDECDPAVSVWVVGLDSELRDVELGLPEDGSVYFMVFPCEAWPGGVYLSGEELAGRVGWDEPQRTTVSLDRVVEWVSELVAGLPAAIAAGDGA